MGELRTHISDDVHIVLKTRATKERKRISEVVEEALRVYLNFNPNNVFEVEDGE